jgi:hypothetical protein
MASSLPPNGLPSANAIRTPQAQATDILQKDAAKANVPVHSFHPDASPAEKAAVAGQAATQLNSLAAASGSVNDVARGTPFFYIELARPYRVLHAELPVDTGSEATVPTITIEDTDKEQAKDAPQLPGDLLASKASQIPDWYKVGWPAFTTPEIVSEDADQKQLRLMNAWLSDQYYGQWYHNAAIITFVCHFRAHSSVPHSQCCSRPPPSSELNQGRARISLYDPFQLRLGLALPSLSLM